MQFTKTIMALVLMFAVGFVVAAPEVFAEVLTDEFEYHILTPAPEGRAECVFTITAEKKKKRTAKLTVELFALQGEATMIVEGAPIGSGDQPGCDIFPNSPGFTTITLPKGQQEFTFEVLLKVHDHPDGVPNNCKLAGHAQGNIVVSLQGRRVKALEVSECAILAPAGLSAIENHPH